MENVISNMYFTKFLNKTDKTDKTNGLVRNLAQGRINTKYIIKDIMTNDKELKNFLLTLGCYEGETVTLISVLAENYVIAVKDARYSIDKDLAEAIIIKLEVL